ncbi:hypothetical protein AGR4C_Lc120172 [Agrobacterium tumefaciens str. Kerr 14]|uniref:Uncharacterized protein n=1 Tax=Agrobacterium tumefaciens str. Kerr 14 TaxID=1183424 RepID=A0A1S7R9T9_AGRTU|nr:hypothetical protein AGR4C_Lc120172 [Agrobacterium tumefaciens str. Kerr 14]
MFVLSEPLVQCYGIVIERVMEYNNLVPMVA